VSTVDSDAIGHDVLAPGGAAFGAVASRWPMVVSDGVIDRGELGGIVFSDPSELEALEAMTHPHIFGTIATRVEGIDGPVVVEIPLLHEAPPGDWRRIVVDCDDDLRRERLVARGMTETEAKTRMAAQASRAEWLAVADLVIPNHTGLQPLSEAVDRVSDMILHDQS
jgi:dephospho-CoA kinase